MAKLSVCVNELARMENIQEIKGVRAYRITHVLFEYGWTTYKIDFYDHNGVFQFSNGWQRGSKISCTISKKSWIEQGTKFGWKLIS